MQSRGMHQIPYFPSRDIPIWQISLPEIYTLRHAWLGRGLGPALQGPLCTSSNNIYYTFNGWYHGGILVMVKNC